MCIGIPMQVIETQGQVARCTGRNGEAQIDLLLVGEVAPGDWLLTHLGSARERIDAERAGQIGDALDALDAVLAGGDTEQAMTLAFGDLIDREPQLPPHLRKNANQETPQ